MEHTDLKIGQTVKFTFAGGELVGEIIEFDELEKQGADFSRYVIKDDEGFRYPIAKEKIIKIIK